MANLNSGIKGGFFGPMSWRKSWDLTDSEVQGIMARHPGGLLVGGVQKMADGKPTGMWNLSRAKIANGNDVVSIWDF